jgi:SAM-dependent methyltransferase
VYTRHTNRQQYFEEQVKATERYILPYLNSVLDFSSTLTVGEIGCGHGGNMKPLLHAGCKVVGIDISPNSIKIAESFYENDPYRENLLLIPRDIYEIAPEEIPVFDLIIMRDTLEHIHRHEQFFQHIKGFLKPEGKLFLAFPPWYMPFGGHQQMCKSKLLSKLPYFHILPKCLYLWILKLFGEDENKINGLFEIKDTRISIRKFYKIIKKQNFTIEKQTLYLVNPNYEVKFGLKPRILPRFLNIPFVREFFTTTYYCVLTV